MVAKRSVTSCQRGGYTGGDGAIVVTTVKLSFRSLHIRDSCFFGNKKNELGEQVHPDPAVEEEVGRNTVGECEDLDRIFPELHMT